MEVDKNEENTSRDEMPEYVRLTREVTDEVCPGYLEMVQLMGDSKLDNKEEEDLVIESIETVPESKMKTEEYREIWDTQDDNKVEDGRRSRKAHLKMQIMLYEDLVQTNHLLFGAIKRVAKLESKVKNRLKGVESRLALLERKAKETLTDDGNKEKILTDDGQEGKILNNEKEEKLATEIEKKEKTSTDAGTPLMMEIPHLMIKRKRQRNLPCKKHTRTSANSIRIDCRSGSTM